MWSRRTIVTAEPIDCFLARRDRKHFDVELVDQGNEATLATAFRRKPRLVLIEIPTNPLMRVVDIRAIAERAKDTGVRIAVDNTTIESVQALYSSDFYARRWLFAAT